MRVSTCLVSNIDSRGIRRPLSTLVIALSVHILSNMVDYILGLLLLTVETFKFGDISWFCVGRGRRRRHKYGRLRIVKYQFVIEQHIENTHNGTKST